MKKTGIILLFLCLALNAMAETKTDILDRRNEIRIGWGDQIFETLMWHNPTSITTTMPESYRQVYKEDFRHHQHLWFEYQRRFAPWFALGAMFDMSEVGWTNVTRNGQGMEVERSNREYFYNLVFMPTMRFTYFYHPNVNIYSNLGIGLDFNGGTEVNEAGQSTDISVALNATVLGFSFNYKRWFCAIDLGGMTALQNKNVVFMAASRMINVSIGARF